MDTMHLSEQFFHLLIKINRTIRHHRPTTDLALNEVRVLNILNHNKNGVEAIQMKDLSEKMHISRPALNALIDKVEARGLVKRIQKSGDRKSVYVQLTEKSQKSYMEQQKKLLNYVNQFVVQMDEEEMQLLNQLLEKFATIIENSVSSSHRVTPNES